MTSRPGTVSKILWHFTGGPAWDSQKNKQSTKLKSPSDAYNAIKSIINSKELRIGGYQEVVKLVLPEKIIFDIKDGKITRKIKKNFLETVESKRVCCVADIPIQHLAYHSKRYGKIALGFHRESIISNEFNPVMYSLENTNLINTIYQGYWNSFSSIDMEDLINSVDELQSNIDNLINESNSEESIETNDLIEEIECLITGNEEITDSFRELLAFIKTFNNKEFDTIYCEREWRTTKTFNFTNDDIAMVILPKKQNNTNYYDLFLSEINLPRNITIAAWEDLIEH